MLARRTDTPSDLAAAAMEALNRLTNQGREYWYMGSMLAKSAGNIAFLFLWLVLQSVLAQSADGAGTPSPNSLDNIPSIQFE